MTGASPDPVPDDEPATGDPRSDVGSPWLSPQMTALAWAGPARGCPRRADPRSRGRHTPQIQVLPTLEGSDKPYRLHLFSTTQALGEFLRGAPDRAFSLRRREPPGSFSKRHGDALQQVVIDAAGPSPMTLGVTETLELLDPQPPADDPTGLFDETGAVISGEALHALGTVEDPGGFRGIGIGIGIELNLPEHWAAGTAATSNRTNSRFRWAWMLSVMPVSTLIRQVLRGRLLDKWRAWSR